MCKNWLAAAAAIIAGVALSCSVTLTSKSASGAEIKVLSAVAVKTALDDLASQFERTSGNKVSLSYATAGEVINRIRGGEAADVTILPKPRMDELVQQGKIVSNSVLKFASAAVGVAVRAGAPKPDISSPEVLKRSLLAANSISYADPTKGGVSGIHFAGVLERLGIVEEMKPKTKLVPGPQAPDLVARGEVEISVTMVPEILPVSGVDFVGPLPKELQNTTDFLYVAGILAPSIEPDSAKALIQFIPDRLRRPSSNRKGLEPG